MVLQEEKVHIEFMFRVRPFWLLITASHSCFSKINPGSLVKTALTSFATKGTHNMALYSLYKIINDLSCNEFFVKR